MPGLLFNVKLASHRGNPVFKKPSVGNFFWKFSNWLLSEKVFKEKSKQHIQNIKKDDELSNDSQIKWEFLKYRIRKFAIRIFKVQAKEGWKQRKLETILKLVLVIAWFRVQLIIKLTSGN